MIKLAIIGAGIMARNYAENARAIGVETYCFAYEKGAVAKESVDHFYPISIFDIEKIVDVCRKEKIQGVVSTTELTVAVAAEVAHQLGLVGISPDVAATLTNKYLNREATKDVQGLHHPKYALIHSLDELKKSDLHFPLILKPIAEGGKRGISVCHSLEDAAAAIEYAASESKRGYEIIAEEFIKEGVECSVEALSCNGKHYVIQVTEKISSGPPHCVELGHIQPARISNETRQMINDVIPAMLNALRYDNGPSHTEIKISDGKIFLIECNTRPGGDFISYPLVDLSTGYHYLQGAINIALNDFSSPITSDFKHECAGVCFLTEQTKALKPIFDICQDRPWCYRKNDVGKINELRHNNCEETNYFIWHSHKEIPFEISQF